MNIKKTLVAFAFLICFSTVLFAEKKEAKKYYNKALELVKAKEYEKAIEYFSLAMSEQPNNDIPAYGRACAKMKIGDIEGAIFDFNLTLEINPNNYQAYHNLGIIEYEANNLPIAKLYFLQSAKIDPSNAFAFFTLAKIEYTSQNIKEAIVYFDKALNITTDLKLLNHHQLLYCYVHRASCHSILKNFDKALNDIKTALKMDSSDYYTHYMKGSILYELQAFNQAKASYDEALRLNPEFGYGYFVRAMAKRELKDIEGAVSDLEIAEQFGYIPNQTKAQ